MNKKFKAEAVSTAIMKYCQAIEVLEWLADDYIGDKREHAAFWFATTNPSYILDTEAVFVANVVLDDERDRASALRYRREMIRSQRSQG